MVAPVDLLDGPLAGMSCTSVRPFAPGTGGITRAMPGSVWAVATTRPASARVVTTCTVPGAPAPNACCTWAYPTRELSPSGTTLIEGMPVLSPSTGAARTSRMTSATPPYAIGRRHRRSAQAANRGERCSP